MADWHNKNIRRPFIQQQHTICSGHVPGSEIPTYLQSVGWIDGEWGQYYAITDENSLDESASLKIIDCKGNPARTGTEQAADLSPVFRILNKMQKIRTMKDQTSALKQTILSAFSNESRLVLSKKKRDSVVDFISTLPNNLAKAATADNIRSGFIANGFIDRISRRVPDFDAIIGTLGRSIKKEEYEMIVESFPRLCREMIDKGQIKEDLFDELGYPQDLDMYNVVVPQNDEISNEVQNRSKVLSHEEQRAERRAEQNDLDVIATEKRLQAELAIDDLLRGNEECENILFHALRGNEDYGGNDDKVFLRELTLEHFAKTKKCTITLLKAFCHVRLFSTAKAGKAWPKKGTLDEALSGADVLVKRAHDVKLLPILLFASPPPSGPAETAPAVAPTLVRLGTAHSFEIDFNVSNGWLSMVQDALDPYNAHRLNRKRCAGADVAKLHSILASRLDMHMKERVTDEARQDHWCWLFVRKNLFRMSAIMILMGHIRKDLSCTNRHVDLLGHADVFVPMPQTIWSKWRGATFTLIMTRRVVFLFVVGK